MKKNFIQKYFENFGLKQISGILLVLGAIALIVSLFLTDYVTACVVLALVASSVVALAAAIRVVMHVLVIIKTKSHRVEFKNALINLIIGGILLIVAVVSIILCAGELVIY